MIIRFHPEAEIEFAEAIRWYEFHRKGLGWEFGLCIDEAIEKIKTSPQAYPAKHKNIRRVIARRFPFSLLYEIHHEEKKIVAVFHSRRNPTQ